MKMIIKGGVMVFAAFLLVICIMDSGTSVLRRNETVRIAEKATYETINTIKNEATEVNSDQEMIAELVKNIVLEYDSNSDIVVKIISIDTRNGMIDLEIDQTFTHSNGFTETNTERRTVILEEYVSKKGSDVKFTATFRIEPSLKKDLYYTGTPQELINAGVSDQGTVQYSFDGINWMDTIPMGTEIGDYTIYYRILGDDKHENTPTVQLQTRIKEKK